MRPPADLNALATRLTRIGRGHVGHDITVNPPVQRASTLLFEDPDHLYEDDRRSYGTEGLAVHDALCEALIAVEGGAGAWLLPSGLAACTLGLLTVARAGSTVVLPDSVYKPTRRFSDRVLKRFGITAHYVPPRDLDAIAKAITANTSAVVMESPGSLTMELQDVPAIVAMAKEVGASTLIDNTWSAGVFFSPFDHGVDYSIQALTKYQAGHADVLMGAVLARTTEQYQTLYETAHDLGLIVSADDAYLALRGLRTMPLRLAKQQETALRLARALEAHPAVEAALHPALASHPDHRLWRRDFSGSSGTFSFTLNAAPSPAAVNAMLRKLSLFGFGYSWGGFESLIVPCDPQLQCRAHKSVPHGPLLRISAGLEAADDLIADLTQALATLRA
jgi:cystathionine beta-lyase